MNQKRLLKELGLNSQGKVVDYFMGLVTDKTKLCKEELRHLNCYIDIKSDDMLIMVSVRFPKKNVKKRQHKTKF